MSTSTVFTVGNNKFSYVNDSKNNVGYLYDESNTKILTTAYKLRPDIAHDLCKMYLLGITLALEAIKKEANPIEKDTPVEAEVIPVEAEKKEEDESRTDI